MNNLFEIFEIEKKKIADKESTLWVEKYRPKTLDEYIGNEQIKEKIRQDLKQNTIQNLLLYGSPGTGKTSLAKIIVKELDCDYLFINASDENSINDIRTKIKDYIFSLGISKLKIVVADEADYLTIQAQSALRNLIEQYSQTRFIFTANYVEKIIPALQSRFQSYHILPPSKSEVAVYLYKILNNEGIEYEIEHLKLLVNFYYPDIRKIINEAQKMVLNKKLVVNPEILLKNDIISAIVDQLINYTNSNNKHEDFLKTFENIRKIILKNEIKNFDNIYRFLFDKIENIFTPNKIPMIVELIAEYMYQSSFVFDKEICFMAFVSKLLKMI